MIEEDKPKKKTEILTKSGGVLYSSDKETIKEAVVEAVSNGADLYEANLREADLRGANLIGANLNGANLIGADLCEADLCEADLREANLYEADLMNAKFYGKGGETKIRKEDLDNFLKALGIVVD